MINDRDTLSGMRAVLGGKQIPEHHFHLVGGFMPSRYLLKRLHITGGPRQASQMTVATTQEAIYHSKPNETRSACH
jgi:hypothetical protein